MFERILTVVTDDVNNDPVEKFGSQLAATVGAASHAIADRSSAEILEEATRFDADLIVLGWPEVPRLQRSIRTIANQASQSI